ncbi:MAG: hypothetical protein ABSE45_14750 [Candidatus Acidiferrales bacterium]|jgi:hypothetical protein
MSVSGLLSSFLGYNNSPIQQLQQRQQLQQEFQQLGQDLQSGNLTAAQSDIATLQKNSLFANATSATSSSQTTNSASQAFNQLSHDAQAGNVSAAKQDFLTLQQDLQGQQAGWSHVSGRKACAKRSHDWTYGPRESVWERPAYR